MLIWRSAAFVAVAVCVPDSAQCLSRWQVPGECQPAHSADQAQPFRPTVAAGLVRWESGAQRMPVCRRYRRSRTALSNATTGPYVAPGYDERKPACKAERDEAFRHSQGETAIFDSRCRGITAIRANGIRDSCNYSPARAPCRGNAARPSARPLDVFSATTTRGKNDVGIGLDLEQLGVERQNAIFIGDQPAALEAASGEWEWRLPPRRR